MRLFKTTIVVWSEEQTDSMSIVDICKEATDGAFLCASQTCSVREVDVEDESNWFSEVPSEQPCCGCDNG